MKQVKDKLIKGIREFFKDTGAEKVIIGISGGADSALTTTLLVEALGRDKVLGVLLPCGKQKDIKDSRKIVKELNINYKIINIKGMAEECTKRIKTSNKLVKANIMARCRMTVLYALANKVKGVVAGTTNKSELRVGYGTKYGDLACDFEVIAQLYKTEVWQLLRLIAKEKKLPILEKIADKSPSAGLWDGQTDEEEFGFGYETLDNYLKGKAIDKDSESKIKRLIKISEHKRNLPPVIKIK